MPNLRALPIVSLMLGAACSSAPPLRVLSSEPTFAPRPEAEVTSDGERHAPQPPARIGAPGGSGAGARSVVPAL